MYRRDLVVTILDLKHRDGLDAQGQEVQEFGGGRDGGEGEGDVQDFEGRHFVRSRKKIHEIQLNPVQRQIRIITTQNNRRQIQIVMTIFQGCQVKKGQMATLLSF